MTRATYFGRITATLIGASLFALGTATAQIAPITEVGLDEGFANPPQSARPRVWWHWMNGNVTIDGIDKDLDWMARMGIGGLQNFDANLMTPQIVAKRLVYMQPDWKVAFKHAVETAEAKGLEFAIAASPGWSETGGPWVKPEDGIKKLVWSETIIPGGKRFSGKLAPAPGTTGPFQTAKLIDLAAGFSGMAPKEPPRASGPVAVVAVPVSGAALPSPRVTLTDGAVADAATLVDPDMDDGPKVASAMGAAPGTLTLDYGKPVTVRSARIYLPGAKPPFGDVAILPVLEVEEGGSWRKLAELPLAAVPATASFEAVTARRFRILLGPNPYPGKPGLGESAPGAFAFNMFGGAEGKPVTIGDLRLSGEARMSHAEEKAGFEPATDYYKIWSGDTQPAAISGKAAIDLTAQVKPDGTLDWTAPKGKGDWRIYRFGWSLTGKTNHPATPEATGLEVDKHDAAAVRRYLETYLGMYRDTVGAELMGKKGIRALLTDSIEVGATTWTPGLDAEFAKRRGYALTPWLPAMAGEVIGSRAETETFLFDLRQTLSELITENHYGTVAKVAHEHGLKVYGEALEDVRPVLGDDLAMRKHADVPMAALWTWARGSKPRPTLLGDMKGASSVAHVYGQNVVAAESMTAAFAPWAFAPSDLKRIIDLEFAYGVNRPVIHTSVHVPVDDKKPGLSLAIFGQYFNRHESWAEMAKPWVDYIARTGFMLQAGRNFADVAVLHGEEAPLTAQFAAGIPAGLPMRYAYDFVNAEMLSDALSVEGGEIVAKGGARYKLLQLCGTSRYLTLRTLRRIDELVSAGARVVGAKPLGSPSRGDDPVAFSKLADAIWSRPNVTSADDVEAALAAIGIAPDFTYAKPKPDSEILFVHRKLVTGDSYFLTNRQNREEKIAARFRVTGKRPELWNAITGERRDLSFTVDGGEAVVPLTLAPEDAVFIVFTKPLDTGETGGQVAADRLSREVALTAPWTVTFEAGRGAPAGTMLRALAPLNEHADPGIKYFSGTATYTTSFTLPKGAKAGQAMEIDLGAIGDVAEVRVNGQLAGAVWFAPHRLPIGGLVKPGKNSLEVKVANLWVNRLIGDAQPGAKPVTFTAAPTYMPNAPLRPSGLIGPVKLVH